MNESQSHFVFDQTEVFYSELTAAEARICVRSGASLSQHQRLEASLSGPRSLYGRTLPVKLAFRQSSAAGELDAVLTDPCYWTPETPLIYDIELKLHDEGRTWHQQRSIGFRPLTSSGRRLRIAGSNWVLRGISATSLGEINLEALRQSDAVLVAERPESRLCQLASEIGVLVMARIDGDFNIICAELARLSRFPSVGLALIATDASPEIGNLLRPVAANILLIEDVSTNNAQAADWSSAVFIQDNDPARLAIRATNLPLPVIAARSLPAPTTLEAARAACDILQRELAGTVALGDRLVDFAGYIV